MYDKRDGKTGAGEKVNESSIYLDEIIVRTYQQSQTSLFVNEA